MRSTRATQGEATGQPVADAIGDCIRRRALSRPSLAGLIDARRFDVGKDHARQARARRLSRQHRRRAVWLGRRVWRRRPRHVGESAAAQAGLAYGLTGLMRALPVHAASGRVYLPAETLARLMGPRPRRCSPGRLEAGLRAVLAEIAPAGEGGSCRSAPSRSPELERPAQAAFLPLSLVEPYLAALEKSRDPLREIAGINPLHRLWRMARWRW